MATEALQRVFKLLSDPTRVRILSLLEREELAVQELMDVLGMAQSRVSRHLAILREAGLLRDRRDGTFVFYRLALPDAPMACMCTLAEWSSTPVTSSAGTWRMRAAQPAMSWKFSLVSKVAVSPDGPTLQVPERRSPSGSALEGSGDRPVA